MNRQQRRARSDEGVHKLVAETAKELAGAAYDVLAGRDDWYRANPSERGFIARKWRQFIPAARDVLVDMLTDAGTSDFMKEQISEGLMLDGAMNPPIEHAKSEASRLSLLNPKGSTAH